MRKMTEEVFIEKLSTINPNIEYLDGFTARNKPVHVKCKIDGYDWNPQARTLLDGSQCPCCTPKGRTPIVVGINDLQTTHPIIASWVKDKTLLPTLSHGMLGKVDFICPNCGETVSCRPDYPCKHGHLPCPSCSDGISYPEKFLYSVFKQLNIPFETQKTYEWSDGKKYDFAGKNWICETHGEQHYRNTYNHRPLEYEIQNDEYKRDLALSNGITNYIVLDCRESSLQHIKKSILDSIMPQLFNFNENDIDWIVCENNAISSKVKEVWDLWNNGLNDVVKIMELTGLSRSPVNRYLAHGAKLGKCTYDPNISIEIGYEKQRKRFGKKVICLNTLEVFDTINDAEKFCKSGNVSKCCKGTKHYPTAGIHPTTGEKCRWAYYEDYLLSS